MVKTTKTTYDVNNDGTVDREEIALENEDKKNDAQRFMAITASISMVIVTIALFLPIIPVEKIQSMSDLISMFYISSAGIIASFFGTEAYLSGKK